MSEQDTSVTEKTRETTERNAATRVAETSSKTAPPEEAGHPTAHLANRGTHGRSARRWGGRLLTITIVLAAIGLGYVGRGVIAPTTVEDRGTGGAAATTEDATAGETAQVWTCSMHPQIRQPRPGQCPICGMDLIPASSSGGEKESGLRELSISRAARELMDIQTSPVSRRYVTATIRMVGKIDYDETRLGYITSWVPGRLDRLYVDYTGVDVQKGDHMVMIYSPDLYSAQAELIRAFEAASREQQSRTVAISAQRLLESAREKLRLLGLTAEQIAEIERRNKPSDHLTIYAPMSGIVIQKNAQEGMYVDTGTRIYTIADLNQVWVKLDAYESDLNWLRYGQEVTFTTEAYPGERFTGQIAFIDPVLNPQTRTVKVRVNVPNLQGRLKPEMFVRAEVHAQVATAGRVMDPALVGKWICRMHPGVIKDSAGDCDICGMPLVRTESLGYVSAAAAANESAEPLVVPASAVLLTGTRAVVYVEVPEADRPTYEGREVVLGPRAGDYYIVRSGLKEGERVVTNGNFKLDSALQIAAKPSMMNPEGIGGGGGMAHQHGEHSAGTEEPSSVAEAMNLPRPVHRKLDQVQAAYRTAAAAIESADREALVAALRGLEDAIAAIDPASIPGQAGLVWKELAMQLRNDAVEARWAATPESTRTAFDRLSVDMGRLRDRFGLTGDASTQRAGGPSFDVPTEFRQQIGQLWTSYQSIQTALAGDDAEAARSALTSASQAMASIEMSLLDGDAHDAWMNRQSELQQAIQEMETADDLAGLRVGFAKLSETMAEVVTSFGIPESAGPVYQLACSMAFEGKGADWLQADEEVRNPYFGAAMLQCATDVALIWNGPPTGTLGPRPFAASEAFQQQLGQLWKTYQSAQSALAADDLAAASNATKAMEKAINAIEPTGLNTEAKDYWMTERSNLREAIRRMSEAESLEPMRSGFALLSEEMPVLIESFGIEPAGPIYRMHCPMAFNGRGASWLQASQEVRNPYFGTAMLRCVDQVDQIAGTSPSQPSEEGHNHD